MRALEITTHVGCKNMCSYCPQDLLLKRYKARKVMEESFQRFMSLDTFKQCVDKLPQDVELHFSGFAEPWLNPHCEAMLRYGSQRGHSIQLFTTLVGMTVENIRHIEHIPFVRVNVHLPDKDGKMRATVDEEYLSVFAALLRSSIVINRFICIGNPHPEWQKLLTERVGDKPIHDRAGNIDLPEGDALSRRKPITGPIVCAKSHAMTRNVLLPNGDVALCCMDYGLDHILGNLLEQSYASLYQSPGYEYVRKAQNDDSMDLLCRFCVMARPGSSVNNLLSKLILKVKRN